jgi:carboxymethylenebutenolidase
MQRIEDMAVRAQPVSFPAFTLPLLNGYLAQPDGDGPFPALVVVHEAFGLNDDIRSITQRFAAEGYLALAVDLFSGRNQALCMARLFAGMLRNSLEHGGVRDLQDALTYLAQHPKANPARVGAVGYCMGGSLAIALACADSRLKAIAPYYAMNPRPLEAVARACPVVGSYPQPDFTTKAGETLDAALDTYGVPRDIKIYPGAKHSFFNGGRNYNADAAQDSWERVLTFFRAYV